jgi:hypothetical protein
LLPDAIVGCSMLGLRFTETLSGTYTRDTAPDAHRRVSITWSARVQGTRAEISGRIYADGLCEDAPLDGEARFRRSPPTMIYDLRFTGAEGLPYALRGQRSVRIKLPAMGRFRGELIDSRQVALGSVDVALDARADLFEHLWSIRLIGPGSSK